MSKQYNIKWTRRDYARLAHSVKKHNTKVFSIEVHNPDIADIQPEWQDYQTVKSMIKTRADLNRFLKRNERYQREGVEMPVKSTRGARATVFEVKEHAIAQRAENTRKRNQRKKIGEKEVEIAGKGTGQKRAEMGSTKANELKDSKKKFKNMSQKEWEARKTQIDKAIFDSYRGARSELLRTNYIRALHKYNYPSEIENIVMQVPIDIFIEIHETDEVCHIDFLYDPLAMGWKATLVQNAWAKHVNEWLSKEGNKTTFDIMDYTEMYFTDEDE